MIRLHNQNRTHTFIDVESGQFISLPKDETDKPPVNADINGLQFFGKTTQDGEPTPDNPVDPVNIPPEFNLTSCGRNISRAYNYAMANGTAERIDGGFKVKGNIGLGDFVSSAGWFFVDTTSFFNPDRYEDYMPANTTFTVSADVKLTELNRTPYIRCYIRYKNASGGHSDITPAVNLSLVLNETVRVYRSFTLPLSTKFALLFAVNGNEVEITNIAVKVGTDNTYSPYRGSTYPYRLEDLDGNLHELRSLPDGTRDEYDRDNGILIKPIVKLFASQANGKNISQMDIPSGWLDVLCQIVLTFHGYKYPDNFMFRSGYSNMFETESWVYGPYKMDIRHRMSDIRIDLFIPKADIGVTFGEDETEEYRTQKMNAWLNAHSNLYFLTALPAPQIIPIKKYGKTYGGVVWDKNEKPKSIQYHTNIFTDVGAEMQCEVRKLGNRAMGTYNWVTENGDKIITEDGDYIMFEY